MRAACASSVLCTRVLVCKAQGSERGRGSGEAEGGRRPVRIAATFCPTFCRTAQNALRVYAPILGREVPPQNREMRVLQEMRKRFLISGRDLPPQNRSGGHVARRSLSHFGEGPPSPKSFCPPQNRSLWSTRILGREVPPRNRETLSPSCSPYGYATQKASTFRRFSKAEI